MIHVDDEVLTAPIGSRTAPRALDAASARGTRTFGGVSLRLEPNAFAVAPQRPRRRFVRAAGGFAIAALLVFTGMRLEASRAPRIPAEVLAAARATRMGGTLEVEVGAGGEVVSCASAINVSDVPTACLNAVHARAPRAELASAMKEVVGGVTYYELRTVTDGLRTDYLLNPAGEPAGEEEELEPTQVPPGIVAAALGVVPDGAVVAVERVIGPESLGGTEFHVKKVVDGETLRIRVRDGRAVEVLRKLQMELKVARDR